MYHINSDSLGETKDSAFSTQISTWQGKTQLCSLERHNGLKHFLVVVFYIPQQFFKKIGCDRLTLKPKYFYACRDLNTCIQICWKCATNSTNASLFCLFQQIQKINQPNLTQELVCYGKIQDTGQHLLLSKNSCELHIITKFDSFNLSSLEAARGQHR